MVRDIVKSRSVEMLIEEYGAFLGFENLAFDDENLLYFEYDGIGVTLEYKSDIVGILLKALISIPAEKATADFLLALTGVNYTSACNGMGTVLIDRDLGCWMWVDRFDPIGMTASRLHERLNLAATHIAFWNREMPEMLRRIEDGKPLQFTSHFDAPMIRA